MEITVYTQAGSFTGVLLADNKAEGASEALALGEALDFGYNSYIALKDVVVKIGETTVRKDRVLIPNIAVIGVGQGDSPTPPSGIRVTSL